MVYTAYLYLNILEKIWLVYSTTETPKRMICLARIAQQSQSDPV